MRRYPILACVLALGSASSASAVNIIAWSVSAGVGTPFTISASNSADARSDPSSPVSAFDNLDASSSRDDPLYAHHDVAEVGYNGEASVARLSAELEASVSSQTSGPYITDTWADAGGAVNVSWSDNMFFDPKQVPVGTPLKVDASLRLNGVYSGFTVGSVVPNSHFASWFVGVQLTGSGLLDPTNGALGTSLDSSQSGAIGGLSFLGGFPDLVIPISFTVIGGQKAPFGETLKLNGDARAETKFVAPETVTAAFSASFKDTLSWGGISRVTDLNTGLPVLDYTVTSDSGFDYSQAAPVPEPGSGTLLAVGIGVLAIRRRLPHRRRVDHITSE